MKREKLSGARKIVGAILGMAIFVLTAVCLFPAINAQKGRVIRDDRVTILKEIAAATRIYRERTGATPKALRDLDGIKLRFAETRIYREHTGATPKARLGMRGDEFTFTADSLAENGVIPYEYLPETSEARNAHLARTVPLAYATTPDKAGRYYCVFTDETIETLTREQIQERIALLHSAPRNP